MAVPPPDSCLAVGVGHPPRHHAKKGTAVGNNYQRRLSKDTTRTPVSVPEQVTVGLGERSRAAG